MTGPVTKVPAAAVEANLKYMAQAALAPKKPKHSTKTRDDHVRGPRGPPVGGTRLLDRHDVCAIANVTYPTIWTWMRSGTFPRSRIVGGKSMWLSNEVDDWLAALPIRHLKGDSEEIGDSSELK
jgi:predicted DNA-binding transcriptional regulator AlpA